MNKKLISLFLLLFHLTVMAQPQLSRDEMHEDFNALLKIIYDGNPQLEVIRQVTGKNIVSEIEALRSQIDTISSFREYFKLVSYVTCCILHRICTIISPIVPKGCVNRKIAT